MNKLSPVRSLILFLTLLVSLIAFSGCSLHHGYGSDLQTEQPIVGHEGHETAIVQDATAVPETRVDDSRPHESGTMMPMMMHGSSSWHWFAGGMMVVMMVLVVL